MVREKLNGAERERLAELGLTEEETESCEVLIFQAGEYICREGAALDRLLLVEEGKAKVCQLGENGRDLILCYYLSQGTLGDLELMTGAREAYNSVVAITALRGVALPRSLCEGRLMETAPFLALIGRELARNAVNNAWSYKNASLHTAEERLCAYIRETSYRGFFREVLTDTASSIGVSYRHLHRMLAALCGKGILEKTPQGYRVLDPARMEKKAAR